MSRPLMRDYLFHLDHVQAGKWAEKNCSVCQLSSPCHGIKKQADVHPGKTQLTRRTCKRSHRIGCTCEMCFAKRIAEISK